jgi:hypothetical protein
MSFSDTELFAHCDAIIQDPAIRNRLVILCEGDSKPFKDPKNAPRISEFSRNTQDSAFYYRAIPTWWRTTNKPEPNFYVCGTQSNVLKAYHYLKEKHKDSQPKDSYLKVNKLFALVDIDVQKTKLKDYCCNNLEELYHELYQTGNINQAQSAKHTIWVTGLLHKEAYFLIPEISQLLTTHQPPAIFNNQVLNDLAVIYQQMAQDIIKHSDIEQRFTVIKQRIAHHHLSNSESIAEFVQNWHTDFNNSQAIEQQALIYILLTIAKSKSVWELIKSANTADSKNYRDELCLKIAREFYAKQSKESPHHFPKFFQQLSQHNYYKEV